MSAQRRRLNSGIDVDTKSGHSKEKAGEPADSLAGRYNYSLRHSFWGTAGATLFQLLQMLAFTRIAGPAAAGEYALAATVTGFLAPLAEAGLGQAVVQAPNLRRADLFALGAIGTGLGVLIWVLLSAMSVSIAGWYGRPDLAGLLPLMGFSLWFMPFSAQLGGLLVRDFEFRQTARIETFGGASGFSVLLVLLWSGWGVWAMAWSFLVRNLVVAVFTIWSARGQLPAADSAGVEWGSVRAMLRFGLADLSARWADFLANYLDKLIVGKWLGMEALGFYQLAFTLSVLPTARLGYVLTRVSYPVFARVRHDAVQLQGWYARTAEQLIRGLFPVYLILGVFAHELISLFYGEAWLAAVPLLQILSLAGLIRTLNGVFPYLTKGIGRPDVLFRWMSIWAVSLVAFLVLFLWLRADVQSAAWSRLTAKLLLEIPLLFWLGRMCGVEFGGVFRYGFQWLVRLAPVVCLAWAVTLSDLGFWSTIGLKIAITGGAGYFLWNNKTDNW